MFGCVECDAGARESAAKLTDDNYDDKKKESFFDLKIRSPVSLSIAFKDFIYERRRIRKPEEGDQCVRDLPKDKGRGTFVGASCNQSL